MAKYEKVKEVIRMMPNDADFYIKIRYNDGGTIEMESEGFKKKKREN